MFENYLIQLLSVETVVNLTIEFIGSALIIWAFFMLLRPKLLISDKIGIYTREGQIYHVIKIINKSFFSIIEVKIELYTLKNDGVANGTNYIISPIALKKSDVPFIKARPFWFWDRDKDGARYAHLVGTMEDLGLLFRNTGGNPIEIAIIGKHSLTGLSKLYRKNILVQHV